MMEDFDPNAIGIANGNYFGLPVNAIDAGMVLVSIPWDATVSYGKGTAHGPEAILRASLQVDLFDEKVAQAWKVPVATMPISEKLFSINDKTRKEAERVIAALETGSSPSSLKKGTEYVNSASIALNDYVECSCDSFLKNGKMVGLVGGDHSVPFGLIKALSKYHDDFGILHIDAHADLREAYEGFHYSHASIMYNVLNEIPHVSRLVQVAIRDYCSAESELIATDERITAFTDSQIKREIYEGGNWMSICDRIIGSLPQRVYISFDIDGLSPEYCPGTGTPVPGGLDFSEADYLLHRLSLSGKKIIGFDLCEVSPSDNGEWDANVGARILYKLSLYSNINREK